MTEWKLMPKYKKNIQEVEFWTKDNKTIQYSLWWRGGVVTITTATDEMPDIDLVNDDEDGLSVYDLVDDETILEVNVDSFWDGDNSEWFAVSDNVTEEELDAVRAAWDEDWGVGLENLGWVQESSEVYFHGELELEKVEE
jgi:hypothetical protein